MIKGFREGDVERLWNGETVKRFMAIKKQALKKLDMLNAATGLNDLRILPGNRLEALKGDRAGQHSIRINYQYRICFIWTEDSPDRVEIVDYH